MGFSEIRQLLDAASWTGWEPVRMIGRGSYGTVYEIAKRGTDGTVMRQALKVISIPEEGAALPMGQNASALRTRYSSVADTMEKEYETMRTLMNSGCKNVVWCYGYKRVPNEDGIGLKLLIRMELLTDLNTYVRRHGISRQAVVQLGIDVCRALEACRVVHVFHRDIKPANLFVSEDGVYKLGDFGVAKRLEETGYAGSKQGTILYMAPEVYKNMDYDGRADMYSLGLVMYQMMNNGQLPFITDQFDDKSQGEALARRMRGEMLPMPAAENGVLAKAVCYACQPDYHDRFNGPTQMRMVLERLQDPKDRHIYLMPMDEQVEDGGTVSVWDNEVPHKKANNAAENDPHELETMTMGWRQTRPEEQDKSVKKRDNKRKKRLPLVAAGCLLAAVLIGVALWKPWSSMQSEQDEFTMEEEIIQPEKQPEPVPNTAEKRTTVSLSDKSLTMIVGQEKTLDCEVSPAEKKEQLKWSSSDETIAIVNDGKITAVSPGTVKISAIADHANDDCLVTVTDREIESIEILTDRSKKEYYYAETVKDGDVALSVTYNDGKTETVTSGYGADYDFYSVGEKPVKVTYADKEAEYTVNVRALTVESITIGTAPAKTDFMEGKSIDLSGLQLKVTYNNGTEQFVPFGSEGIDYTPKSFSTAGKQTVSVSYGGKTASLSVTISRKSVTSIDVSYTGKTTYYVGDSFDTSSLSITANYNNDTSSRIAKSDCDIQYDFGTPGTRSVKVSYGGKTKEISVTVADLSISVSKGASGGSTMQLSASTTPGGQSVSWYSSDSSVVSVSSSGVATAKRAGTATVTASVTLGGKTYSNSVTLTVKRNESTGATEETSSSTQQSEDVNGRREVWSEEVQTYTTKTQYHYYRYYGPGRWAPWTFSAPDHPYYEEIYVDQEFTDYRNSGGVDQYGSSAHLGKADWPWWLKASPFTTEVQVPGTKTIYKTRYISYSYTFG